MDGASRRRAPKSALRAEEAERVREPSEDVTVRAVVRAGGVKRVPVERDGGGGKLEQRLFASLQGGGDIGERGVFARQCDPVGVPCEFGAAAADFTLEGGVELFGPGFKKASGPVGDAAELGAAEHFGSLMTPLRL